MVNDVVGTAPTVECYNVVEQPAESATYRFFSLALRQLFPGLAMNGSRSVWKPPWLAQRSHRKRHTCPARSLRPGFKKNNAVFVLIYFGLIFTFLLSSANCNLSAAPDHWSSGEEVLPDFSGFNPVDFPDPPHAEFGADEEMDGTAESESRLHRQLFEQYSKDARPSRISNVSVHLQVISLDDVQESGHIVLTVQIWMTWRDLRFRWSPSNYSGVVNLQILPVDRIWFPLFWIRNSAQPDIQNSFWSHFPAFIGWTGIVSWVSSGKVTVACDLDFFYYPSDSQTCSIQFAAHDSYHVNLTSRDILRPMCFDRYTNNSLWDISGVRAIPKGTTVHSTNEYLSFDVRLRRKPLTDVLRIFLPTACLAIVSLIAFLLPPDSSDKLNVTFTTMLAFFVMFLAITDTVPFTAEHTPIMTHFVVSTLLLSTIETILCAVVMTIADTEKAHDAAVAQRACEESSRQSALLLQQIQQMTKAKADRLQVTSELVDENESTFFDGRPRSYSTGTTDSGIIDLNGTDAAIISAFAANRKLSHSGSEEFELLHHANNNRKTLRHKVGTFFIELFHRAIEAMRKPENGKVVTRRHRGYLVSAATLNLSAFFLFGIVKILTISLVSVILYDQSRQEDVVASGFQRPEYSNCWH